jgi:FKBP-type peptidyl-prolyl cis-trans isomerase FklB
MKKSLVAICMLVAVVASAQKKGTKPVTQKTAVSTSALKTQLDSVSYAVGLNLASFYAQQGIKELNPAIVAKAITDVMKNNKRMLTDEQSQMVVMRFLNPGLFQNIEKGEKFLVENKKRAGVKTTASGLQYEIIKEGNGERPLATDTVEVNYAGTLINGVEFDNSYKRGAPISFPLNRVISGWTEALQLMSVGAKYKLYIPHSLGYGMNDQGQIPGGSVLVFEVELLSVKKAR